VCVCVYVYVCVCVCVCVRAHARVCSISLLTGGMTYENTSRLQPA
jgi:hypothetical protein